MGVKAVIAIQADVASADFGTKIVRVTLEAFGATTPIGIVINNAGISRTHAAIADVPLGAWDSIFHTNNVRAPFPLIQAALPHMSQPGGRIVNIGSVAAKIGRRMFTVYGALTSMSVSMAEELGGRSGSRSGWWRPGPIDTETGTRGSVVMEKLYRNMHIKREGMPLEVAGAGAWLVGEEAGFVTGQLISVDGGWGTGWP
ncbi:uncharacterized protein PG986_010572 [Apiospora aurea]|uniref:Uncharacterized protein n=1 Tax=Apiospora aurea TaxID=335848 RepID=A0ABR1Q2N2_9PEZI